MFFYIKDYFHKRIFHILLIVFFGLLMFNSVMYLIDLKNYEVVIDYSRRDAEYYQILKVEGGSQVIIEKRPYVKVEYKGYTGHTYYRFTWVSGQILAKNITIEDFTIEYAIYGHNENSADDKFTATYDFSSSSVIATREYDYRVNAILLNVVDYDIKFHVWIYLPHIFVFVGGLFFIIPSIAMLVKIRQEEK